MNSLRLYNRISFKRVPNASFVLQCCKKYKLPYLSEYDVEDMYGIMLDNTLTGFILYSTYKSSNGYVYANIDTLVLLDAFKGKGVGTCAVWKVLKEANYYGKLVRSVYGEAASGSVGFWKNIGANFGITQEQLRYMQSINTSISFTLTKARMEKALGLVAQR